MDAATASLSNRNDNLSSAVMRDDVSEMVDLPRIHAEALAEHQRIHSDAVECEGLLDLACRAVNAFQGPSTIDLSIAAQERIGPLFRSLIAIANGIEEGRGDLPPERARDLGVHIDYALSHLMVPSGGFTSETFRTQILADALLNVVAVLCLFEELRASAGSAALPDQDRELQSYRAEEFPELYAGEIPVHCIDVVSRAERELEGWCSWDKSALLMKAILAARPEVIVEIGIFGGRSIVPCAVAARENGGGTVFGIEAWSADAALDYSTNDTNDAWWAKIDYGQLKRNFMAFCLRENLFEHIKILETRSTKAATLFDTIDFVHIDGGHSVYGAAEDVILYAKKLRPGGLLVFDDVNWPTTYAAVEIIRSICDIVGVVHANAPERTVACAIFRRR